MTIDYFWRTTNFSHIYPNLPSLNPRTQPSFPLFFFCFSSLDNNLYFRFSRDNSRRVNNVQLGVQGILLCDGGYSATINKDQQPGRPSQCSNYAKDKIQSRSFGDSGKGAITTKIETANGGTIGCESYVIIGFDAKVNKIENAFWPIKTVKKLNKQLDVCTGNNNGCDGFFWRLEEYGRKRTILGCQSRRSWKG